MDKPLDDLISAFTETAASLFPRVARHLGASQPISNIEWACLEVPQKGETSDGVKYFKHGYGVSMYDGHRTINMDVVTTARLTVLIPGVFLISRRKMALLLRFATIRILNLQSNRQLKQVNSNTRAIFYIFASYRVF